MSSTTHSISVEKVPFGQIPHFSNRDRDYVNSSDKFSNFYSFAPNIESFKQVINDRKERVYDRGTLIQVIKSQYENLSTTELTEKNIQSLSQDNTYTVVTAHQPSLFTGPLYFVYKIISAIQLAKKLNNSFSNQAIVPIFVLGSEDHDFEEINHMHIFGNAITWNNDEQGAVGNMHTSSLGNALAELKEILGKNGYELYEIIHKAHTEHDTYGEAVQAMVNELFGEYGLIVLHMGDARLKKQFAPIIKKEIFEQPSQKLIEETGNKLQELGYDLQATPREINFFYLEKGMRERIVQEGESYSVLNTSLSFSRSELEDMIDEHPERFSPNVVMRPIYQEHILPNLAYIGGGGELAYWLERKSQFAHFGMAMPVLIRRHSAVWIDKGSSKKMEKLGLSFQDLLEDEEQLIKRYVKEQASETLNLSAEKKEVAEIYTRIVDLAERVDASLVKKVKAEQASQMNSLSQLEGRLIKAEKQKQDVAVQQIRSLYEKLFPNRGLQERHNSFLELYVKHGKAAVEVLMDAFEPFDTDVVVIDE